MILALLIPAATTPNITFMKEKTPMKHILRVCALIVFAASAWAQISSFPPSGGGGGGSPAGSTGATQYNNAGSFGGVGPGTKGNVLSSAGAGVAPTFSSTGVFNVRLMYGAVPDGSTDNSTAIAAAFAASNLVTTGIPTVYFDCDTGTITCVYNYGGSGTSPINPTVGTTIACAPGTTLNYTGSAHAADIGATGLSVAYTQPFTIQGCRFTGGATMTQGIYVNTYNINISIQDNLFNNFGNQTGYTIKLVGSVWRPTVSHNFWNDTDGASRNMLDAHDAANANLIFTNNNSQCLTSIGGACSNSTIGVGLWIFTGKIEHNIISFHAPEIRISNCITCGGGAGMIIRDNDFEGATSNWPTPQITFGDPGATGSHVIQAVIEGNVFSGISNAASVPFIGPEAAGSGNFNLDLASIVSNLFQLSPGSGAVYVNTNQGVGTYVANNFKTGTTLDQHNSPPIIDTGFATQQAFFAVQSSSPSGNVALPGIFPVFDSNGVNLISGAGKFAGNTDLSTFSESVEIPNESGTGTTVNKLAKLTGAPSTAIIAGTSDTSGIVGVVVGGAGTTGNAQIARMGQPSCVFDGATTAGDYVQISSGTAGDCHDAGATYPSSGGQVLGFVLSTHGGGGTYAMLVRPDIQAGPRGIASGTATLGTGAISANSCASAVTVAGTGILTTDTINWVPNGDISAITGYGFLSTDGLKIYPYPTSGNVNFKVCNGTGTSITPGAVTLNWSVVR